VRFSLLLYITGASPISQRAIASLKAYCEEHLPGRYDLEIIDVHQQPELAEEDRVLATPTLIRKLPLPLRRLVGDVCDPQRLMSGLNLNPEPLS
jgi:circadian clock protein KaiB